MYLVISEDGAINKADEVTSEELCMCDDGVIDILWIDKNGPLRYSEGEWVDVEPLNRK